MAISKTTVQRRCSSVRTLLQLMLAILMKDSLEKAAEDPMALAQQTIIENLDPREAERLSKVRNIGIAVREPFQCYEWQGLIEVGTHRQRQDHGNRTCPLLHRPNQFDTRSTRQRFRRC